MRRGVNMEARLEKLGVAAVALALVVGAGACTKVDSDEIGVRVVNIPVVNRVEKTPKTTGYHGYLPALFSFYKLPRTHMRLDMSERGKIEFKTAGGSPTKSTRMLKQETAAKKPELPEEQLQQVEEEIQKAERVQIVVHQQRTGKQSVRVKTADGNDAWVDVTVDFQIIPDKAYLVVEKMGTSVDKIQKVVSAMVRGTIRSWLGELDSKAILRAKDRKEQVEGVYEYDAQGNPAKKLKDGAIHDLNDDLEKFGIRIVKLSAPAVAIHPDYEAVLSQKRIAEEEREEYISYQRKAIQEKQTKVYKAKGEADSMIELSKGRYQKATQEADAEFDARKLKAEATRTRLNQNAKGIEAITRELSGPGGESYVGLEVSKALQGKRIIIVPGQGAFNMLDLNELIQSYGAARVLKQDKGRVSDGVQQQQ